MSRKDRFQKVRKTPWLTAAVFTVFTVLSLMATMPLLGCTDEEIDTANIQGNQGYCPGCNEEGEYHRAECGVQMHFSCVGNHGLCTLCEQRYCNTNEHKVRACGIHYDCTGNTIRLVEGDHEIILNCGYYVCEDGHKACKLCGDCTCTGVHGEGKCKQEESTTNDVQPTAVTGPICPNCEILVDVEMEHQKACGHWSCDEGYQSDDHEKADCGHWICAEGFKTDDHQKLGCGHFPCAEGFDAAGHAKCVCETWLCTEGLNLDMHRKRGCGHMECQAGTHEQCDNCDAWLCKYESERYRLECNHYVCDECDLSAHAKKDYCGCFACDSRCDHVKPEPKPESTTIYCGGCGQVVSSAGAHTCEICGNYKCVTVDQHPNGDCTYPSQGDTTGALAP